MITKFFLKIRKKDKIYLINSKNFKILELSESEYYRYIKKEKPEYSKILDENGFYCESEEKDVDDVKNIFFKKKYNNFKDIESVSILISVTSDCNLRCKYCSYIKTLKKDTNISEKNIDCFFVFLSKLKRLKRVSIQFTGGEPLLNYNGVNGIVKKINKYCNDNDIIRTYSMTSNGCAFEIDDNVLSFLFENKIKTRFSYHFNEGGREDGCQDIINKKIFYKNIEKFINKKIKIGINYNEDKNFVLIEEQDDIKKKIKEEILKNTNLEESDIDDFVIFTIGGTHDTCSHHVNGEKKLTFGMMRQIYNEYIFRDFLFMHKTPFSIGSVPCCVFRGGSTIMVDEKGDIYSGPLFDDRYKVGTLFDDLDEVSLSLESLKNNAEWIKDEKCLSCPVLPNCFGGCVNQYINNNNKPSDNCFQEKSIFEKKVYYKRVLNIL